MLVETRTTRSSKVIKKYTAFLLLIIVIVVVQFFYLLERNYSTQAEIDNVHNRKVDIVMRLSKVVRERSLYMLTMYLSKDPWEQDDIFTKYHHLKLVFLELHDEMQALGLTANESVVQQKINEIINRTEQIQNDIVERIQSGGDEKIHSDISELDMPLEYKLLGHFDEFIDLIRENGTTARENVETQYRNTQYIIATISILVFLSVLYLMRKSLIQINIIESSLIDEAETLSWDATHDALTNVYNRRWLQHKFNLFQESNESTSTRHTLLYIDLDEFKPVNDNYGHVAGDNFLCGITRKLEQCIRHNDTLARMGGDEFAILLENCEVDKAIEIADCLVKRVDEFFLQVDGKKVSIAGCSIGIKAFNSTEITFAELIKQADSACYEAKKKGKNQSFVFQSQSSR